MIWIHKETGELIYIYQWSEDSLYTEGSNLDGWYASDENFMKDYEFMGWL